MADVEMSARRGRLKVRSGKGDAYREVPLNSASRKALDEWFEAATDQLAALAAPARGGDVGVVAVRHRESILGRSYPVPTRAASCSPRDLGRFQRPAIRTPSARTSATTPSHDETVAAWAALSLRTLNP